MSNNYLPFIKDQDLFECIEFLCLEYEKALGEIDYKKFFKNRIDTFKMSFDNALFDLTIEEWLTREIKRQIDKSITNHYGTFHEMLIGKIDGYSNCPVGDSYDIMKDDETLFAEVKNKHNTVTGTHVVSLFNKIKTYADKYPEAICYYVRIIDTKSRNDLWSFYTGKGDTKKHYCHERIRIISGDEFYKLITGENNAFALLCEAVPKAISFWVKEKKVKKASNLKLYATLHEKSEENTRTLYEEIIHTNYTLSEYINF